MKSLLVGVLLVSGLGCTSPTVYVCDSPNAVRYHLKPNCRGLGTCDHRIIPITLEKAKKAHLSLCKWEQ